MSRIVRRGMPPAPGVASPQDRRFRRSDLLVERRRLTVRVRRFLRWGLPVLAGLALVAWGVQTVLASPLLQVRDLKVVGNKRVSASAIEALVSGLRDEHILRVDLAAYRERLLTSPWVQDARFSRVLPATIEISVVERAPMAVARLGQQLYLVGEDGSILDDYGPAYREFDLPVVDGLVTAPKTGRPFADADRARLTADLFTSLASRPDLRDRISQADVSNPFDAVVMFDDDAAWLHLGDRDFTDRLQRYVELRPTLAERFGDLDYVDLRFDTQVYLRGRNRTGVRQSVSR